MAEGGQPRNISLSYTTIDQIPYAQGTSIVIPANLRQTFNATANNEIGGLLCLTAIAPNTLSINGTFIIGGDVGGVDWNPIITSFRHNSYMMFHTHPPQVGGGYNGYSSADLGLLFRYLFSIRRTRPVVSIHYALFTPTDIHFTFVDEICFKIIKTLIKIIRNQISNSGRPVVFTDTGDFTECVQIFFVLLIEQVIVRFITRCGPGSEFANDVEALNTLDNISFLPFPIHDGGVPNRGNVFLLAATERLRNSIANGNFTDIQITNTWLRNQLQRENMINKIREIGIFYFNPASYQDINITLRNRAGEIYSVDQHRTIFNTLGLFKTTSAQRAPFIHIGNNDNIMIRCIDSNKIFNETISWPMGQTPPILLPPLNSPIAFQDGGALQKGGVLTTGAFVKLSNTGEIIKILPIKNTTRYKQSKKRSRYTHRRTHRRTHRNTHHSTNRDK